MRTEQIPATALEAWLGGSVTVCHGTTQQWDRDFFQRNMDLSSNLQAEWNVMGKGWLPAKAFTHCSPGSEQAQHLGSAN